MYDLIVVGGGVAGLMAAGVAAQAGARVLLLEKMEKTGRKLRITGKGRCNLTNDRPREDFLAKVRQGADFVGPAFDGFDNRRTVEFMEGLGVAMVTERGGRIYPASGKAWDVAQALVGWARRVGVEVRCDAAVEAVLISEGAVQGVVLAGGERMEARAVVLATGGVSYPATGSTGEGHTMAARDGGHRIEPLSPALVPLEVKVSKGLKGLALKNVEVALLVDGEVADRRFGEVEFTGEGILGGAVALQLSRTAVDALLDERRVELSIDLKPALTLEQIERRIERECAAATEKNFENEKSGVQGPTDKEILRKLLPRELVPVAAQWSREEWPRRLKAWRFAVTDYRPFTEAVVTAGGVDLAEVEPATMESKRIRGLYFAGELLDVDADTGGYNIQLALSTGHAAGRAAAAGR